MPKYKDIDYNVVSKKVYYDETSPSFLRWLHNDTIAGGLDTKGYYIVCINNSSYRVHRVIWVLFHKVIDSNLVIDHDDRNPANNNIINLILTTQSRNSINKRDNKRDNDLPRNISYHTNKRIDNNGRNYMTAMIRVPDTGKRISKSGYDLQELLIWLELKRKEFKINIFTESQ